MPIKGGLISGAFGESRPMRPNLLFCRAFPGGKPHTLFLKALYVLREKTSY